MRIAIISKGRSTTLTTPFFFDHYKNSVVVITNPEELAEYQANPRLAGYQLTAANVTGLIPCRNWVLDNIGEEGEWLILMDDNLLGFERVKEPEYSMGTAKKKEDYEQAVSGDEFVELILADLNRWEKKGVTLYGTAVIDDWFFRRKKYKFTAFIQHKCCAIKKTGLRYDTRMNIREEYQITAETLLRQGVVVRNEYLFAKRQHFMEGGIGSREERNPGYLHDAKYLISKYPGLFRINNAKKDCLPNTEICIVPTSLKAIHDWRMNLLLNPKKKPSVKE